MNNLFITAQRKINDLIPNPRNPRKLSGEQAAKLEESLKKFGLVDLPTIDESNHLLSGHMRLRILQALGHGEEVIDVRMPIRPLTEEEKREYSIRANVSSGEWNSDMLGEDYQMPDLENWGIDSKVFGVKNAQPDAPTPDASSTESEKENRCPQCGFDLNKKEAAPLSPAEPA